MREGLRRAGIRSIFCGGRYSIISRCIGQQPSLECFAGQACLRFFSEHKVAQRKTTIAGDIRSISRASAAPDRTRSLSHAASGRRVNSARLRCRHQAGSRTGVAHGPGRSRPELLGPFMVRIIWDNHFLPMQRIAATSHKHSTRRPSIPPPSRRAVRRCHPGRQKSGLHCQPVRLPSAPPKNPEMAPRRHRIVESVAESTRLKSSVGFSTLKPMIYG